MLPTAITMRFPFSPIRISTDWRNYYFFFVFRGNQDKKKPHKNTAKKSTKLYFTRHLCLFFLVVVCFFFYFLVCVYIYICVCVCVCVYVCVLV